METIDLPVLAYDRGTEPALAALGFARAADGIYRDAAGRSFANALTGADGPLAYGRTYGCQMNLADSESIHGQLAALGYGATEDEGAADLIFINTCAVRGSAAEHALGEVGRLKALKQERPQVRIAVCGCLTQMPETVRHLQRYAPHVDLVFGTHNLHQLPQLLHRAYVAEEQVVDVWRQSEQVVEALPSLRAPGARAWVNIIYGCDKYCTYCIVPYTRGKERSRRPGDVLAEVEDLAARGYTEITLLGQNVNSYGKDLAGAYDFADLLRDLDRVRGIRRIRYMTSHPRDFTQGMVDAIAASEKVCEHFHLPVQAGSDRVLRWMNRGYTRADYMRLIDAVRRAVPHAVITTDIIVGFPRETEADFAETLALVREVGYDNAFTFMYSPRDGTPAARWADPVPLEVKKDRLDRLNEVQYAISRRRNEALVGREFEVLIEGPSRKDPTVFTARTRGNKLVHVPGGPGLADTYASARVHTAHTWTLDADLLGQPRAAAGAARGAG